MIDSDIDIFCDEWVIARESCGVTKQMRPVVITRIFKMLQQFELNDVLNAISVHVNHNKFAPTPSDIVAILDSDKTKHIDKNEAWSICYMLASEEDTAVITQQMREAWRQCYILIESGDKTGARMAFNETYDRLCKKDPSIRWEVQPGTDMNMKYDRVKEAVELGRLGEGTLDIHMKQLPSIGMEELMAKALEHNPVDKRDELRARWSALGKLLSEKKPYSHADEELRLSRLKIARKEHKQIIDAFNAKEQNYGAESSMACEFFGCYKPGSISHGLNGGDKFYCKDHFRVSA